MLCIWKVFGSNLGRKTGCSGWGFSWVSLEPACKGWRGTSMNSRVSLLNSSFVSYAVSRRYIASKLTASLNKELERNGQCSLGRGIGAEHTWISGAALHIRKLSDCESNPSRDSGIVMQVCVCSKDQGIKIRDVYRNLFYVKATASGDVKQCICIFN